MKAAEGRKNRTISLWDRAAIRFGRTAGSLRRAALRRPGLRPGGRALFMLLALLAAGLALAPWLELTGPAPTLTTDVDGVPVLLTDGADEYLSSSQVELALIEYLALNAWAENVQQAAMKESMDFSGAMLAAPSKKCAADYRIAQLQPQPEADPSESPAGAAVAAIGETGQLTLCVQQEMERAPKRGNSWDNMPEVEREAHARARLRMMWQAISPPYQMEVRAALQHAVNLNAENNDVFSRFTEEYSECAQRAEDQAPELAKHKDGPPLGNAWLDTTMAMRECAFARTQEMFPVPEKTPTPEPEPGEPEPAEPEPSEPEPSEPEDLNSQQANPVN